MANQLHDDFTYKKETVGYVVYEQASRSDILPIYISREVFRNVRRPIPARITVQINWE